MVEAICAQPMRWLAILHSKLRHVGDSSSVYVYQLVAFALCRPVFQAHNLLFKIAYALGSRRLRHHCRVQRRLGFENPLSEVHLDILDRKALGNRLDALYEVESALKAAYRSTNFSTCQQSESPALANR